MANPIKAALGVCRWQSLGRAGRGRVGERERETEWERERGKEKKKGGTGHYLWCKHTPPLPSSHLPASGHQCNLSTPSPCVLQAWQPQRERSNCCHGDCVCSPMHYTHNFLPDAIPLLTLSRFPCPRPSLLSLPFNIWRLRLRIWKWHIFNKSSTERKQHKTGKRSETVTTGKCNQSTLSCVGASFLRENLANVFQGCHTDNTKKGSLLESPGCLRAKEANDYRGESSIIPVLLM